MINQRWDAWRRRRAHAYLAMTPEQRVRHHQIRQIAVLVTLPGLVLGGAGLAAAYGTGAFGLGDPAATCTPTIVTAPARNSFDLHVQNATGVGGRATEIARDMSKRNFRVVEASTANENLYVRSAGIIYHGGSGLQQALLVQTQLPGARLQNDGRKGTTINLVIGSGYTGLIPRPPDQMPRPNAITVNVFNTTWREGLATAVSKDLVGRGFKAGKTGNDPNGLFLPEDVAVIRYGADGDLAAKRLAQHVPGATLEKASLSGNTLDLVIGNKYAALTALADVPELPPPPPPVVDKIAMPCE